MKLRPKIQFPCRARARYGSDWPGIDGGTVRVDADAEVICRHYAADQDGWDGGVVCQTIAGWCVIDLDCLRLCR